MLAVPLLLAGCASPGGNLALGTTAGGTVGIVKGAIEGKVNTKDIVANAASGFIGAEISNQGAEKRIQTAYQTGIEVGDNRSIKQTYAVVQNVHKVQESKEKIVVHQYEFPAQPGTPEIKEVPHTDHVEIKTTKP